MGQSARHHDIGRRIDFGGPALGIMQPFGAVGDYPSKASPPYQVKNSKRLYRRGGYISNPRYFSGGYLQTSGNTPSIEGGCWHHNNLALSWSRTTLYAYGRFVDLATSLPGGVYGVDWQIASIGAASADIAMVLLPSHPWRDLITATVVIMYRLNSATMQYRWRRYALIDTESGGDTLTVVPIAGDFVVPGGYPYGLTYHTQLSHDASQLAILVEPRSSVDDYPDDRQRLHLVTLDADLSSATATTILETDVDHITTTTSETWTGANYLWDMAGTRSASLSTGDWTLSHLTMGDDALYAVGQKHVSYSMSRSESRRSIGESGGRPGFANASSSESRSVAMALLRISYGGAMTVLHEWTNVANTVSSSEKTYDYGAYAHTVTDTSSSDSVRPYFVMPWPPSLVARVDYGTITTSSTSVRDDDSLSTTGTRTLTGNDGVMVFRPDGDIDHTAAYDNVQSLDAIDPLPDWPSLYADMYGDVGAGYSVSGSFTSRFLAPQDYPRASAVLRDEAMWHELDIVDNTFMTHYIHGQQYDQISELIAYPDGVKPMPNSASYLSQIAVVI